MMDLFKLILGVLGSLFKSRAKLEAEILILRQQINVLRRRAPKRPHLNNTDGIVTLTNDRRDKSCAQSQSRRSDDLAPRLHGRGSERAVRSC